MSFTREIAALRAYVDRRLASVASGLFGWTIVSASTALGDGDQVESLDDGTDPDSDSKGQRPVTRVLPFGFQSRQPTKLRGLSVRLGASNVFFIGIGPQKSYGPQDLDVGETALYCKAGGTEIRLDKDGNVKINAASGKDVVVNAGTAKVARVGDHVGGGTLAVTMGVGPLAASVAAVVYIDADGVTNTLTTGNLGPVSVSEKIKEGADHFKG